jgi:orotidine-5'-phosphate decarboxylase
MSGLIIPLDVPDLDSAVDLVDRLGDEADFYKVGLELYTRVGPPAVEMLQRCGKRVFLDLKLHDIPNTVAGAVRSASELGVDLLTLHAQGGAPMLEAAAGARGGRLRLLAVTVLTSLESAHLEAVWGRSVDDTAVEVHRLARMAAAAGIDGVVSSPLEAASLRSLLGPEVILVTPGIRPTGSPIGDQRRFATPADAVRAGADYLVVGRPVTQAPDPGAALAAVLAEIRSARTGAAEPSESD